MEANQPVKQNVWRLIKHARNILFKHNSWNERISKGENLAAGLVLGVTSFIAILLAVLIGRGSVVSVILVVIVYIVTIYFMLKLMKQRFNDLGIGRRGMRWTIAGGISGGLLVVLAGAAMTKSIALGVIVGIAAAVILGFVLWHNLLSQYETGSEGDNRYGTDPLLRQPRSNKAYIVLGLIPMLLWLGLMLSGIGGSILMNNFGINPSSLGGSMMDSNGMMQQNFDADMTEDQINQQIDTAFQAQDTQTAVEATTTNQ